MTLLADALAWFVEPARDDGTGGLLAQRPGGGTRAVAPAPDAQRLAVLGSAATAPPLAAAVALASRTRAHVPAALVALWRAPGATGPVPGRAAPALPGAAALGARLVRRSLPVAARGHLVWLLLDDAGTEAAALVRHAEAAAGDVPSVLALARPREAAIDALLAERELIIVAADPGSALAAAALDDLDGLPVPARACSPPAAGAARLTALAGLRSAGIPALGEPAAGASVHHLPGATSTAGML
jgi:hypothetical protein